MNVAEQIVGQLVDAGVHRIYGIVGDSLNPIVDAVRKTGGSKKGGIDWTHVRHEEAAAFAASAEAQLTGKLAVCAGSCGPATCTSSTACMTRTARAHLSWPSPRTSRAFRSARCTSRRLTRTAFSRSARSTTSSFPPRRSRRARSIRRSATRSAWAASRSSHLPGDISDLKAVEHVPTYAPARPRRLLPTPPTLKRPQPS